MARGVYLPMKDARHRIAALALYRALVRTGQKIPLPEDLHSGPVHPIVQVIRKRVNKNKNFSSPRLVFAAMAAGYKFLTMFTSAHSPESVECKMIISQLQKRRREADKSREITRLLNPPRKYTPAPVKPKPPLLTKISPHGAPPKYVSTIRPVPKSAFQGHRKVPVLSSTADGIAYLRTKKPTPEGLAHSLRHKKQLYVKRHHAIEVLEEINQPFAKEEDNWDRIVDAALREEGLREPDPREGPFSTYERSERVAVDWIYTRLKAHWKDALARGEALNQLVEDEKALAMLEQCMPSWTEEQVKAVTEKVEAEYKQRQSIKPAPPQIPEADPFVSRWWQNRVARDEQQTLAGRDSGTKGQANGSRSRSKGGPNRRTPTDNDAFGMSNDPFRSLSMNRKSH